MQNENKNQKHPKHKMESTVFLLRAALVMILHGLYYLVSYRDVLMYEQATFTYDLLQGTIQYMWNSSLPLMLK